MIQFTPKERKLLLCNVDCLKITAVTLCGDSVAILTIMHIKYRLCKSIMSTKVHCGQIWPNFAKLTMQDKFHAQMQDKCHAQMWSVWAHIAISSRSHHAQIPEKVERSLAGSERAQKALRARSERSQINAEMRSNGKQCSWGATKSFLGPSFLKKLIVSLPHVIICPSRTLSSLHARRHMW